MQIYLHSCRESEAMQLEKMEPKRKDHPNKVIITPCSSHNPFNFSTHVDFNALSVFWWFVVVARKGEVARLPIQASQSTIIRKIKKLHIIDFKRR